MTRRRVPPVLVATALAAALGFGQEKPASGEAAPSKAAPSAPAPGNGVVVHGERPPAAQARAELQPGVTRTGAVPEGEPAAREGAPVVRVRVERGTMSDVAPLAIARPELPPVRFGLDPPSSPKGAAPLPPAKTIGPTVTAQQGVFGTPPASAAGYPRPETGWVPTSAYEQDARVPYPWNPATFDAPTDFTRWVPAPSYPQGQDDRNWSPATWATPTFDPTWEPSDAFERDLD